MITTFPRNLSKIWWDGPLCSTMMEEMNQLVMVEAVSTDSFKETITFKQFELSLSFKKVALNVLKGVCDVHESVVFN